MRRLVPSTLVYVRAERRRDAEKSVVSCRDDFVKDNVCKVVGGSVFWSYLKLEVQKMSFIGHWGGKL